MRLAVGAIFVAGLAGALLVWPSGAPPVAPTQQPAPVEAKGTEPEIPLRRIVEGPALVRTRARERAEIALRDGAHADLEPNSVLFVDADQRGRIQRGRVTLSVPRQPEGKRFAAFAGPYLISVLGTRFHVRVAGDSVGVDVEEGAVEVWRAGRAVHIASGESWTSPFSARARSRPRARRPRGQQITLVHGPAGLPSALSAPLSQRLSEPVGRHPAAPAAPASSAPAPAVRPATEVFKQAQVTLADGHPKEALDLLEGLARGHGPAAENAAYEAGRVLRDHLRKPRQAIGVWTLYRARFPAGILRAETDLSILETLVALEENERALAEAEAFLRRHADSERRGEVERAARRLRERCGLP